MATPIISDIRHRYSDMADFCYVYVSEAHARDEWPLGDVESHPQPTTLEERRGLACRFHSLYCAVDAEAAAPASQAIAPSATITAASCGALCEPMPILVDGMDNAFAKAYAVWPERFFVIEDSRLSYISKPCNELGFDRSEIQAHLERIMRFGPIFSKWSTEEGPSTGEEEDVQLHANRSPDGDATTS